MANLKIRIDGYAPKCNPGTLSAFFSIEKYIIGNYEDAIKQFSDDAYSNRLSSGIMFHIGKSDEQIADYFNHTPNVGYSHIFLSSIEEAQNIRKVEIDIIENSYYYPNGEYNVFPENTDSNNGVFNFSDTPPNGIAGELFTDNRISPKGTTIKSSQIEIGEIYDGYVFPLKLKFYTGAKPVEGYRFCGGKIEYRLFFLDKLERKIIFKLHFGDYIIHNFSKKFTWTNNVLEEIHQLNSSNEVFITPENFNLLQNKLRRGHLLKDIHINTLPKNGELLLNNKPISINQIISKEDLYNGMLKYQSTNNNNDDFSIKIGCDLNGNYVLYKSALFIKK